MRRLLPALLLATACAPLECEDVGCLSALTVTLGALADGAWEVEVAFTDGPTLACAFQVPFAEPACDPGLELDVSEDEGFFLRVPAQGGFEGPPWTQVTLTVTDPDGEVDTQEATLDWDGPIYPNGVECDGPDNGCWQDALTWQAP